MSLFYDVTTLRGSMVGVGGSSVLGGTQTLKRMETEKALCPSLSADLESKSIYNSYLIEFLARSTLR